MHISVGVLSTGMLHKWIIAVWDVDIRELSSVACSVHLFFTYVTVAISAWSLALISIERTISVCIPFRYITENSNTQSLKELI
jgi:hypothetical protein